MTTDKIPGIYLEETVTNASNILLDNVPLFIVQTTEEIGALDNKLTRFESVDAFEAVVTDKGLTKTLEFIKHFYNEIQNAETVFYVYSVKTDTPEGFKTPILETTNREDIENYIYFEETKSSQSNTISHKITAINQALSTTSHNAHIGRSYIIPYGTVEDAVTNKDANTTAKDAAVAATIGLSSNIGSGRISIVFPDVFTGAVAGKCYITPFNEEVGYSPLNTLITALSYQLSSTDMLNLLNAGVIFLRERKNQNNPSYEITLGVTSSFATNGADGYLISRRIADEMLRDVITVANDYLKVKNTDETLTYLNSDIKAIIDEYVSNKDVIKAGTSLKAVEGAVPYSINIVGTIQPVKCVSQINIQTTLK